jgi:RNA polymerase sigma factor (sigma-70 family)
MERNSLVRVLVRERVKMLAYIQSLVRSPELSEDLFQDMCALAVEKSSTIENEAHFMNWLRTTARYLSLSAMQKRELRNQSLNDGLLDLLEPEWKNQDASDATDHTEALRHCMDLLPPRAKNLVQKRYLEEMNYTDLARAVNRPVASLYVTFSRIFTALGNCISSRLQIGGDGG